ncbi:MAG: 4-amino-4-deoxy-L-arabinose transferase-like glycosyltransferase [Cellvibrionaceae bacterium]|jgi:4-amino-4-deoxy-L-arabinose transferase-like glycosyltransferase
MHSTNNRSFIPILIAYIAVASLYALLIPAWEAPDEPAHYNYIRQLAAFNFPVMTNTDYNQDYQSEVISKDFDPSYSVEPFSYEDYQPPLYYLIQTPVYWLSGGWLSAMRLFGVFLGAITLTFAWLIFSHLATLAEWDDTIPLLAVSFFAFLPQHISIQASINNDSLTELLLAAGLLFLIKEVPVWQDTRRGRRERGKTTLFGAKVVPPPSTPTRFAPTTKLGCWLVVVMSLALLTKVTAYLLILVVGITIITVFRWDWSKIVRKGFETFTIPFLVGCLWWGRNLAVYGWPDFLGIQAHDAAVIGQPTTASWIAEFGLQETLRRLIQTTFRSFWGQFGWMEVVMPRWVYLILAIFSIIVLVGFSLEVRKQKKEVISDKYKVESDSLTSHFILLTSLFLLNLALFLAYNLTFVQHQGRYFFASLIPISLAVAIGIWFFIGQNKMIQKLPWGHLLAAGLVGLNLLALFRFILPAL